MFRERKRESKLPFFHLATRAFHSLFFPHSSLKKCSRAKLSEIVSESNNYIIDYQLFHRRIELSDLKKIRMDFYSCKTLAADTEYYMQLGSKKYLKTSEINLYHRKYLAVSNIQL